MPRFFSVFVVLLMAAGGLAGCFETKNPDAELNTMRISRVVRIEIGPDTGDKLDGVDSPEEAFRRIAQVSFEVRVSTPGAYTLAYTDRTGAARNATLPGLTPGVAATVDDADLLSGAQLTSASGDVVASRASLDIAWWRAGDVPLGVRLAAGDASTYALETSMRSTIEVSDLDLGEDGDAGTLTRLVARLDVPVVGTVAWRVTPEGASGDRVDVDVTTSLGTPADKIVAFSAEGVMDDQPTTVGLDVPAFDARATAGFSMWFLDGALRASQFNGGSVKSSPQVFAWATGGAEGAFGEDCAGTQDAPCQVGDMVEIDETQEASEKETFDDEEFLVGDDEEAKKALAFLKRFLGTDLQLGDRFVFHSAIDEDAVGDDASEFEASYTFELSVADEESVTVPAGTFDALKIVETQRILAKADRFVTTEVECEPSMPVEESDGNYTYPPPPCPETETPLVTGLALDEMILRSTLWLHKETFQPLKAVTEAPFDVDRILREVLDATTSDFWADAEVAKPSLDKLTWTTTSRATMEATTLAGATRFSPYGGLLFGTVLAHGAFGAASAAYPVGLARSVDVVEPAPVPATPMRIMLEHEGRNDAGDVVFRVVRVSGDARWWDISFHVDGGYLGAAQNEAGSPCEFPEGTVPQWMPCNDSAAENFDDSVDAGDRVLIAGLEPGATVELLVWDREQAIYQV